MKKIIQIFLLSAILSSLLYNCQKGNAMNDTYVYETGSGCDENYPIDTYRQVFYSKDNKMIQIDGLGFQRGPWGNGGVTYVKNEKQDKELPATMKVGYYSYAEDKFYEGEFNLPAEKIKEYLNEKADDPEYANKKNENSKDGFFHKYDRIEVGFTLGGMVVLWMKGEDAQKVLATFTAKEAFPEWSSVFEDSSRKEKVEYGLNNDVYTPKVKNEILTKTLPLGLWKTYEEQFSWGPLVNLPSGGKLENISMKTINAETETLYNSAQGDKKRAVPYNIEFFWSLNGKYYNSRIVFGENMNYYNAIYKATKASAKDARPSDFRQEEVYKNFHLLKPNESAKLSINVDDDQSVNVSLKQGDQNFPFKNVIAKTFEQ
ncbi:hypothetical protein DRF65_05270 [Chryseobacterium pennae]|uniref:DUF2931 family protein n=1 Tax=Chryseobacterium pennae TaxID=2258962 RepID=A0A3D9CCJ1_9FLAO|nr:DUF2931 family protein [Chryseobacterium pennae]REC63507.1 hypothetical protein DRF65_05270 [Chryseobacterium pennae]